MVLKIRIKLSLRVGMTRKGAGGFWDSGNGLFLLVKNH